MFTGIVREVGVVSGMTRRGGLIRLSIQAPSIAAGAQRLDSIAVNGACLSVVDARPPQLQFELIPETRSLTTLAALRRGDPVNLEPSLLLTDRLNGHLVLGHVDGMGTVRRRRDQAGERALDIRVDRRLGAWLVPKGPVTVDGVSLTAGARATPTSFTVHLIPETLRLTTLRHRQAGDRVNLEFDYVAKLVRRFLPS